MNVRWILAELTPDDVERMMESFHLKQRKIVLDGVFDIGEMTCDSDDLNPEFCCPCDEIRDFFDRYSLTLCSDVYLEMNSK